MKYAEIILPLALQRNYTYHVPSGMESQVRPGVRVTVQFGANKKYAGIVKNVHDTAPSGYRTKAVLQVLDVEPLLFETQLKFWQWLAEYYMCSEGEVMNAALPAHFKLSSETRLLYNGAYTGDLGDLPDAEYLVAEALSIKKELSIGKVQMLLDKVSVFGVIRNLMDKGICLIYEDIREAYKVKLENFISLNPVYEPEDRLAALFGELDKSPRQLQLLMAFIHLRHTLGEVRQNELLEKSTSGYGQLKGLLDKHILVLERRRVDRIPASMSVQIADTPLTDDQLSCYEKIKLQFKEKAVTLLHGITSSGKTMVYIRLIRDTLDQGRQAVYLLPEIALTTQIIRRLQAHFGETVGVYHSRFSDNERVELWQKVKSGEIRLILGARSALLLPFHDLGLVVLDEEHDSSFKQQEPAPRYHARDAAIYYSGLFGAKVVLGSATPSLESYHNALTGKYGLAELTRRYGGIALPQMEVVRVKRGQGVISSLGYISETLRAAIVKTLEQSSQVILFQNRRGFSLFQICTTCGWTYKCESCEVSLAYHKLKEKMQCHYCGRQYPPMKTCPACGGTALTMRGFGTEKVEEDIASILPKARVGRLDLDTVRAKDAHRKLIQAFEQRRLDILVGTQMVVKGLDFDHVTLVGILNADSLMNHPDFRASERAFQLMEQVSGRAGRRDAAGKVIIQAFNTDQPVLKFVLDHDYKGMYASEIGQRKHFRYPPFCRLIRITCKHKQQEVAERAAVRLAALVPQALIPGMLGPVAPYVFRIRGYYLYELLIRLPLNAGLIRQYKAGLKEAFQVLGREKAFSNVVIIPDVDMV
jgi:primosomal protein N' (replication factor Y)